MLSKGDKVLVLESGRFALGWGDNARRMGVGVEVMKGDMPAVVATTKRNVAPIDLVANTGMSQGQHCNVVMVRADAPKFKTPEEAIKWLDGKIIATPQGSCAHRFLGAVSRKQSPV